MKSWLLRSAVLLGSLCAATVSWGQPCHPVIPKIAVTTYHYDTMRTGWNSHEVLLNPTLRRPTPPNCPVVQQAVFDLLAKVTLDDTVYAQPLIVPDVTITGGNLPGKHDVVYVATENNTIFAIDANTGDILLTQNLGPAVLVQNCANNGPRVGIESTPVIDLAQQAMYVISYMMLGGKPAYLAHAINLATLKDIRPPIRISASHIDNGRTFAFDASIQRQRPGLLLQDGNLYAAFGSFCDQGDARGWLLQFHALPNFIQVAANELTNTKQDSPLSSIWMSGYGVAGVPGEVYYATGNSRAFSYDVHHNASNTVVKVASDFSNTLDFFTPIDVGRFDGDLRKIEVDPDFHPDLTWPGDMDFGSGGVLLLPDQPGGTPHLATAAGKEGWMYLLDRDHMGRFDGATDNVLGKYPIGGCFCGESYYLNKIVSSGGNELAVWQVTTSPSPGLTKIASVDLASLLMEGWGDGGFFTAISSNGEADPIIWAVSRHHSHGGGPPPTLFAFQVNPGEPQPKLLFQSIAGNWDVPHPQNPKDGANSNIVPVVANGHVYVASYKELDIFGFRGSGGIIKQIVSAVAPPSELPKADLSKYNGGVITKIEGLRLMMKTAAGAEVRVDATEAVSRGLSPALVVGQAISVYGSTDAQGVFQAQVIKSTTGKKH